LAGFRAWRREAADHPACETSARTAYETPVQRVDETPARTAYETPVQRIDETPVQRVDETPAQRVDETTARASRRCRCGRPMRRRCGRSRRCRCGRPMRRRCGRRWLGRRCRRVRQTNWRHGLGRRRGAGMRGARGRPVAPLDGGRGGAGPFRPLHLQVGILRIRPGKLGGKLLGHARGHFKVRFGLSHGDGTHVRSPDVAAPAHQRQQPARISAIPSTPVDGVTHKPLRLTPSGAGAGPGRPILWRR